MDKKHLMQAINVRRRQRPSDCTHAFSVEAFAKGGPQICKKCWDVVDLGARMAPSTTG